MRFQCRNSPLANAAGFVDVDKEIILGILSCVVIRCRCQKCAAQSLQETCQHNKFSNVFSLGDCSSLPTSKPLGIKIETLRRVPSTSTLPSSFSQDVLGHLIPGPSRHLQRRSERAEQCRAVQSSAEQCRAVQSSAEQCRAVQSSAECRERTGGGSVSPVGPGAGSAVRQRGHFHLRWLHSMSRASGGRLADSDCASRLS